LPERDTTQRRASAGKRCVYGCVLCVCIVCVCVCVCVCVYVLVIFSFFHVVTNEQIIRCSRTLKLRA
jgi:uncharacterized membrane protein